MSFANRLEKITANAAVAIPTRNDWTLIEVYARAGFGFKMEELRQVRYEPVVLTPHGKRIVFVDFCPGGVMCNRQDVDWINQGICAYETFATEDQKQLFDSIRIGDVLVMKTDRPTSLETTKRIRAHMMELMPQGVKLLILDPGIELSVMSRAEIEAKVA